MSDIDEGPSAEDLQRFSGDTACCPNCRQEIHDQTQQCPACGEWVIPRHRSTFGRLWKILWLLIALLLVIFFLMP